MNMLTYALLLLACLMMPIITISLTPNLLLCLLNLEALTLTLILTSIITLFNSITLELLPPLLILSLGACEASMGLAILVKIMRNYGSDNMKSLSITKC